MNVWLVLYFLFVPVVGLIAYRFVTGGRGGQYDFFMAAIVALMWPAFAVVFLAIAPFAAVVYAVDWLLFRGHR